jgi:hypothetical protein
MVPKYPNHDYVLHRIVTIELLEGGYVSNMEHEYHDVQWKGVKNKYKRVDYVNDMEPR